jgi:ABC-type branched-subunit amino acid transport system substrate-binding protein
MADNVFSVNASLAFQGQVLARFAEELKAKQVAVLVDGRRTANVTLAEAFSKEFSKVGSQAPRQWVYKSEAELVKAIQESKEGKPEALVYAGAAAELTIARRNLQAAGLTIPLLLAEDGEFQTALEAEPKLSGDVYLVTPYVLNVGTPELQEFAKKYQKLQEFAKKYQERFHESPGTDALLAYDGVQVLLQAIRRANIISTTGAAAKVRAELASPNEFESLTGGLLFDRDHSAQRPLFVVRFKNGETREAKRFEPEVP